MTAKPGRLPAPGIAGRDRPGRGILLMVASTVLFAILWAFVKELAERYPIVEVSFFRSLFAMLPVAPMLVGHGKWKILRVRRLSGHFWRALLSTGAMICGFTAYHLMPLSDAVAISFMAPLVLTALSVPFLGERVGVHRWTAVVVGFGGVLVIVHPGAGMLTPGVGVAVAAAIASAIAMVTIRQLNRTDAPLAIVFYFTLFSTLLTALPLPWMWVWPGGMDWVMLVLMGTCGGIGQYLMTRAFALAPAAVISPFNYAGLLWATALGWMLWGERLQPHVVAGAAVVIASGLYILYRETWKRSAALTTPTTQGP